MKKTLFILVLGSLANLQSLSGKAFLAQATDGTSRDARSHIHYGDSIQHEGVVTYLITNGKRVQFTRDNLRAFVEGFNQNENITTSLQVSRLKRAKPGLLEFARRFPGAKAACLDEIKIVEKALERIEKGEIYMDRKWVIPDTRQLQPQDTASENPSSAGESNPKTLIDGEQFTVIEVSISDVALGLAKVVHSFGTKIYPARKLPEECLKLIPTNTKESEVFIADARRQRGMSNIQARLDRMEQRALSQRSIKDRLDPR